MRVSRNELERRTPTAEVEEWLDSIKYRFTDSRQSLEYFENGKGLAKEILEELVPLSKYCAHEYPLPGFFLQFYSGSERSYDADILDQDGHLVERIEVTMAVNGFQEALRNECLDKHGAAPSMQDIAFSGRSSNRNIPEQEWPLLVGDEALTLKASLLQAAYDNKYSKRHKYTNTTLLIGIDLGLLFPWEQESIVSRLSVVEGAFKSTKCVDVIGSGYWKIT